ncbi:cell adhesion molecule 4-like [Pangshura tecta]
MGPARWGRGRGRAMLAALGLLWAAGRALAQEVQTENMTVVEGGVAEINCRLHRYDGSIVVIQNPARQTLFFNGTRALKDERFQLVEFTQRQVRILLSDVRLEDEGGYFCQLYTDDTHHQIASLTVLEGVTQGPKNHSLALSNEGRRLSEVLRGIFEVKSQGG